MRNGSLAPIAAWLLDQLTTAQPSYLHIDSYKTTLPPCDIKVSPACTNPSSAAVLNSKCALA